MTEIDVIELDPADDDHIAALTTVRRLTDAVFEPDDPPVSSEEVAAQLRTPSERARERTWVAFEGDAPVGALSVELELLEANASLAEAGTLAVVPDRRRRGVATAMLRVALPGLLEEGRTSLMSWVCSPELSEGRAFAARLGLTERSVERCSRLLLSDLDEDLIDAWRQRPPRADGYRLIQFTDVCPEEFLEAYTHAQAAMADMPTDELDWTFTPITADAARDRETRWQGQARLPVRTLAVTADGRGAGLSELFGRRYRPTIVDQGDTGVGAEHRGRGLGRWLKASNLAFAREQLPEMRVVETYNAETNPWMLDINVTMGFRPHVSWTAFQGDLAGALAAVS